MYKHLMIWISKANHQMVVPNGEHRDVPIFLFTLVMLTHVSKAVNASACHVMEL